MRELELTRGYVALVDDADYLFLRQWKWSAVGPQGGQIYAVRGYTVGRKAYMVRMHRQILGAPEKLTVDHANRNTLDNRKCNLRLCTEHQNAQNRVVKKDGYRGVHPTGKRFQAIIQACNRRENLGIFDTAEEAARTYDAAAKRLHGDFAVMNFP